MSHTPPRSVVQLFGNRAQKPELPVCTTSATSNTPMQVDQLDVSRKAVRGLLRDAEHRYNNAFQNDDRSLAMWYDGYMRAIYHILEMEDQ